MVVAAASATTVELPSPTTTRPTPGSPPPSPLPTPPVPLEYGADPHELEWLADVGLHPQYAQVWTGAWLARAGWDAVDAILSDLQARNTTPVIQFYYWGDDLTRPCFEQGCTTNDGLLKTQAGWQEIAAALADHLVQRLQGAPAVIVLETEFNKELRTSEGLDEALAVKAQFFHRAYPAARVALGFGNWGRENWPVFDRASQASDELSLQLLRASTRHDLAAYRAAAPDLLDGARELHRLFHKPILVSDVALSTYGEGAFLEAQRHVIDSLFALAGPLEEAGVYGFVYRSVVDATGASASGYFGEAERHFGLVWGSNRTAKPAFDAFQDGVLPQAADSTASPVRPGE